MKTTPRCFISSVGTSILTNSDTTFRKNVDSDADDFIERCAQEDAFKSRFLNGFIQKVIKMNKLSAEIDALKKDIQPHDCLVLLSSKTDDAYFCAKALETYFSREHSLQDIEIKIVEGLREPEDEYFQNRGLPDFLNTMIETIESKKETYKLVLNPTGGYKSLFPLMTIVGIIYEIPVIYTYEKTNHVITIPPLPLHVHLPAWTQMESLIQLFANKTDFQDKPIYQKNKDQFGLMLYEKNDTLQASALRNAFSMHASIERGQPELIVRTQNSPLLNFLTSEQQDIFLKLTAIGHLIWKGDRVPEMADHALKHHSDLFHLAERVLLPIFYYKTDFLNPHELFILLCGLYLHDCGHVIHQVKQPNGNNCQLFPAEIRDYHHVLGYLRMKHPEINAYMGNLLYEHLCGSSEEIEWKTAWNNYFHAIALTGLYHRKRMFLETSPANKIGASNTIFFDPSEKTLKETLQNEPVQVFGEGIDYERLKLIISLLRIIDSLDEQASRTGSIEDIKFHLVQLKVDAQIEQERVAQIASYFDPAILDEINSIMDAYIHGFESNEKKGATSSDTKIQKLTTHEFRKKIEHIIDSHPKHAFLLFEYVSAYLRKFFKDFQKQPYAEKAYIKGIDINHKADSDKITLYINLIMEDDPTKLERLQQIFSGLNLPMKDLDAHKKDILAAIEEEYTNEKEGYPVVKNTLEKAGIFFQYGIPGGLS